MKIIENLSHSKEKTKRATEVEITLIDPVIMVVPIKFTEQGIAVDPGTEVLGLNVKHGGLSKESGIKPLVTKSSIMADNDIYTRKQVRLLAKDTGRLVFIFRDKVLDLTKWSQFHPGGLLALQHCAGQDATDQIIAFHPVEVIENRLPRFIIGSVAKEDMKNISPISIGWRKLDEQLKTEGLYDTDYHFYYREGFKSLLLLSISWALVLWYESSFWMHVVSALSMALLWHQAAFVAHDAGHNGITHDVKADRWIGIIIANFIGGLSIEWWKASHNVHHILTNHVMHDPDIQHLPFFAVSNKFFDDLYSTYHKKTMHFRNSVASHVFVSVQHYLFYIVLFFGRFNLFIQSYIHLARSWFSKAESSKWAKIEVFGAVCFWIWYLTLLSYLPDWSTRLVYFVISNGLTFLLHIQITISHFGLPADDMPLIETEKPFEEFATRNLRTTMDVDCPEWMDWFHGGLQYQVTHHLFPRLPRHRLRAVRPRVMKFASDHGLSYQHYGFVKANGIVLGSMRDVANQVGFYLKVASHLLKNK